MLGRLLDAQRPSYQHEVSHETYQLARVSRVNLILARTCALLGGFALLKRLGSLRVGGALQHWKA